MTETLNLNNLDSLINIFTKESGIDSTGLDVDQFVSKGEKVREFLENIVTKYSNNMTFLSHLKNMDKELSINLNTKYTKEKFDLYIAKLLPPKTTLSNFLGCILYQKNEYFYSSLNVHYYSTQYDNKVSLRVIPSSIPIKKKKEVNINLSEDDYYDEETVKGAELLEKDKRENANQESHDIIDHYIKSYLNNIGTDNDNITVIIPMTNKRNDEEDFRINVYNLSLSSENIDKEIRNILMSIFSDTMSDMYKKLFPSFKVNNILHQFSPYTLKQDVVNAVDDIINNIEYPFSLKIHDRLKENTYATRVAGFVSRLIYRELNNRLKSLKEDVRYYPYYELINSNKNFFKVDNLARGVITNVISRVSENGEDVRYVQINLNNNMLILTVPQDSHIYEGMDVGNYILIDEISRGSIYEPLSYAYIVRKENKEYLDILEDNLYTVTRIYSRNNDRTNHTNLSISSLIFNPGTLNSKFYATLVTKPKNNLSYILKNSTEMVQYDYYRNEKRYNSSFSNIHNYHNSFYIVNQDLDLYNQVYRELLSANKISKTISIDDPTLELQLNIENEAKQKIDIFKKGLKRISEEGKPFSIAINDNQTIEFTDNEIKFGNQKLSSSIFVTVYPERSQSNDAIQASNKIKELEQKLSCKKTFPLLSNNYYGYSIKKSYRKINKDPKVIDIVNPNEYSEYDNRTGAYKTDENKRKLIIERLYKEIDKQHEIIDEIYSLALKSQYYVRPIKSSSYLPVISLFPSDSKITKENVYMTLASLGVSKIESVANSYIYLNGFSHLQDELVFDRNSMNFLMKKEIDINDIDFNSIVNRFINKLDYYIFTKKYDYFDSVLREQLPIGTKTQIFTATLGNVDISVSVTRSATDTITWYLNNKKLRRDEMIPVIRRALCFNNQKDYDTFIDDISTMSLRARNLIAKGLDVTITNSNGSKATVLLEFERKNKIWYLIIRDTNNKKIKELEIEGGVVKFANSLIKKEQNTGRYTRKKDYSAASFMTLMKGVQNFTVKDAQHLIANGLKSIDEVIARSRKLLEDTARMTQSQYITHTYGNKTIKGYLVIGASKAKYLVACDKQSLNSGYNGTDKFAGVFSMPTLTKICIVDKSIDQNGYDIIVNRILALKNDIYIAHAVTTLLPYVNANNS